MKDILGNFDPELLKQWAENMITIINESSYTAQEFSNFLYSDEGKQFVDNIMMNYLISKYNLTPQDSQNILELIKESIGE